MGWVISGLGTTGTIVIAAVDGVQDPIATGVSLGSYGALGVMCWLLWKDNRAKSDALAASAATQIATLKEKDVEFAREREAHRDEREQAWRGVTALREELQDTNKVLIRIEEHLRPKP